jgi:hypothetical protein
MIITVKMLKSKDACFSQVKLFQDLFGDAVEVTRELCLKHASDFDFNWAAMNLLNTSARRAYEEAVASAWRAYDEAVALAFFEVSQQ